MEATVEAFALGILGLSGYLLAAFYAWRAQRAEAWLSVVYAAAERVSTGYAALSELSSTLDSVRQALPQDVYLAWPQPRD